MKVTHKKETEGYPDLMQDDSLLPNDINLSR